MGRKQRKSWVMGSCRLKVKDWGWDESSTKVLGCAGGGVVTEGIVMYQSYAQQNSPSLGTRTQMSSGVGRRGNKDPLLLLPVWPCVQF